MAVFENRILGLLVELGIPELLAEPTTVDELAVRVGADADTLDRVLRFAASRGYVRWQGDRYRSTGVTEFLRRDHPNSYAPWVDFGSSEAVWRSARELDAVVRSGPRPWGAGRDAASGGGGEGAEWSTDQGGSEAGSRIQALALSRNLDWAGVQSVCDVGGGVGTAVELLLREHRRLHAAVLDLPAAVDQALPTLRSGSLAARCELVAGNFFEAVPDGYDRYLVMAVLTECDDEHVVRLLETVGRSLGRAGRVLVVDNVLDEPPTTGVAQATDLLLLALHVGRERTRRHLSGLFEQAGLRLVREHHLFTGSVALELAPR